jgi:hypothetical protein
MYQPLDIPPGQFRNGTDLESAGRWRDMNLVRWDEGSMQPVGGWSERDNLASGIYRGAVAWRDNGTDRWVAAGSASALKAMTAGGTIYDITPAGFTTGNVDAENNLGYGGSFYGTGSYGTPRPDDGTYTEADTWSLEGWGEYLLACSTSDGKIYEWQLDGATPAAVLSNAPTDNSGIVVTEERFVFALGADGDPRQIKWSDRENNNTWTPAATNEAGDYRLETDGQIMCGVRVPGQTLILTNREAYAAEYTGPPFVYGFDKVGSACGIIARHAVAVADIGAVWMGREGFYAYAGGGVEALNCDVADYVFNNINTAQITKAWAVPNQRFSEVWFFYPSSASTECDSYVIYNYRDRIWATGSLARTAGVDRGVFNTPILFGTDSKSYNHESGTITVGDGDGAEDVYAETGPILLGSGGNVVTATGLIPDEKTQGDVELTIKTRMYPNDTETSYGPYQPVNPVDLRLSGRQLRLRVSGARSTSWRWGVPRIMVAERGRR